MAANTPAVHNVSQVVSHLKRDGGPDNDGD